jgi:hypothetical protein
MLFLDDTQLTKKLSEHPLEDFFPDFTGGTDYDAARDYLLQRFISENKCAARRIYANFTSSTQTSLFGCMWLTRLFFLYVSLGMLNCFFYLFYFL